MIYDLRLNPRGRCKSIRKKELDLAQRRWYAEFERSVSSHDLCASASLRALALASVEGRGPRCGNWHDYSPGIRYHIAIETVRLETSVVSYPMADEIMQELWAARDAIAAEADHDLDKLCQLLKERQAKDAEKSQAIQAVKDAPES